MLGVRYLRGNNTFPLMFPMHCLWKLLSHIPGLKTLKIMKFCKCKKATRESCGFQWFCNLLYILFNTLFLFTAMTQFLGYGSHAVPPNTLRLPGSTNAQLKGSGHNLLIGCDSQFENCCFNMTFRNWIQNWLQIWNVKNLIYLLKYLIILPGGKHAFGSIMWEDSNHWIQTTLYKVGRI